MSGFVGGTLEHLLGGTVSYLYDPTYYGESVVVYKASIGGTNSAYWVTNYSSLVAPHYDGTRPFNVHTIGVGTNDYLGGFTTTDVYNNILTLVGLLKATGYNYVIVNTPPSAARFDTDPGDAWRQDLATKIRSGAVANGYLVADEAANSQIGCRTCWTTHSELYTDDTHFNASGYAIKGSIQAAVLQSLGIR